MATHSSILAWKIPWTEKPNVLQSMGSQRVRHDRVTVHEHEFLLIFKNTSFSQSLPYVPLCLLFRSCQRALPRIPRRFYTCFSNEVYYTGIKPLHIPSRIVSDAKSVNCFPYP